MKRYQKLIITAADEMGYTPLARTIGAPSTSIHEWATQSYKIPHYKSLEKIAAYFKVPIPTLLMEVDDVRSREDDIVEALFKMTEGEKESVAEFIKQLLQLPGDSSK